MDDRGCVIQLTAAVAADGRPRTSEGRSRHAEEVSAMSDPGPNGARPARDAGFTLIELMTVVAIIGLLVAIAIPQFVRFQMRAKTSEGKVNLASIARSEHGYFATYGTYVNVAAPVPAPLPAGGRVAWPVGSAFDVLGWQPEGQVYFVYLVSADNAGGAGAALRRFTAEAASDIDGDGAPAYWGYVKPVTGASTGLAGAIAGSTCAATGIYDSVSMASDVLETVGPCDASSGRSVF
jgi:type IV pilus assembly protein PilA